MPTPRRRNCRDCGRHVDECGPLSSTKLCEDCGERRHREAVDAMIARRGPAFQRYIENQLAGVRRMVEQAEGDS